MKSADFAFPLAGFYILGLTYSANAAANASFTVRCRLEYRAV